MYFVFHEANLFEQANYAVYNSEIFHECPQLMKSFTYSISGNQSISCSRYSISGNAGLYQVCHYEHFRISGWTHMISCIKFAIYNSIDFRSADSSLLSIAPKLCSFFQHECVSLAIDCRGKVCPHFPRFCFDLLMSFLISPVYRLCCSYCLNLHMDKTFSSAEHNTKVYSVLR